MNTCAGTQISLFDYLLAYGWKPARDDGREEVAGLCPLHRETRPSFYVNRRKQLFYCHACGRGGGLAQLRWWMESPALSRVQPRQDPAGLMEATYRFYQQQLPLSSDALVYLRQRGIDSPAVIQSLRIGYAPPACLRAYLWQYGFRSSDLRAAGILNARGCAFVSSPFPSKKLPVCMAGRLTRARGGIVFCHGPKADSTGGGRPRSSTL